MRSALLKVMPMHGARLQNGDMARMVRSLKHAPRQPNTVATLGDFKIGEARLCRSPPDSLSLGL